MGQARQGRRIEEPQLEGVGQQALRTCRVSVRSPCGTATEGVTSRLAPVLTRRLAWLGRGRQLGNMNLPTTYLPTYLPPTCTTHEALQEAPSRAVFGRSRNLQVRYQKLAVVAYRFLTKISTYRYSNWYARKHQGRYLCRTRLTILRSSLFRFLSHELGRLESMGKPRGRPQSSVASSRGPYR